MPHLTLEFSANILEKNDMVGLLKQCHLLLARDLPTALPHCKSRAIENNLYCVGDGQPNNAFIHVSIKIMPGRSEETLKKAGDHLMEALKTHFAESLKKLNLQITLEFSELQTYFKTS